MSTALHLQHGLYESVVYAAEELLRYLEYIKSPLGDSRKSVRILDVGGRLRLAGHDLTESGANRGWTFIVDEIEPGWLLSSQISIPSTELRITKARTHSSMHPTEDGVYDAVLCCDSVDRMTDVEYEHVINALIRPIRKHGLVVFKYPWYPEQRRRDLRRRLFRDGPFLMIHSGVGTFGLQGSADSVIEVYKEREG